MKNEVEQNNSGIAERTVPHIHETNSLSVRSMGWGQYLVFSISCLLVSILFITQAIMGRLAQREGEKLALVQQEVQRGEQSLVRWQQLAGRTYQLSQNDAALRDVVVRQDISVKGSASTTASASSPVAAATSANSSTSAIH